MNYFKHCYIFRYIKDYKFIKLFKNMWQSN